MPAPVIAAITAAASFASSMASKSEGDKADKVLGQGERERKMLADTLKSGPDPSPVGLGQVGLGQVGVDKVGASPVGTNSAQMGGGSSLLKKPNNTGMASNLGGLSRFG